ncbi:hypothetical protein FRC11_001383 [Ceratobasidium sp. 423]|nr:hypothetical protein FRC11_001383 [Ceratobasidium sp. 423]
MLSSLAVANVPQKRPLPASTQVMASKRGKWNPASSQSGSRRTMDDATHAPPLPSPINVQPRSSSQQLSLPSTPVRTRMDSPRSNYSAASSSSSTRRARPPPGSPVWNYVQQCRAARQQESSNNSKLTSPELLSPPTAPASPSSPRAVSPLLSASSHNEQMLPEQGDMSNTQAGQRLQERACRKPLACPNKDTHLRQLQDIVSRMGDLSTSSGKHTVDQLLLNPSHLLYLHVFVACLMHAFY